MTKKAGQFESSHILVWMGILGILFQLFSPTLAYAQANGLGAGKIGELFYNSDDTDFSINDLLEEELEDNPYRVKPASILDETIEGVKIVDETIEWEKINPTTTITLKTKEDTSVTTTITWDGVVSKGGSVTVLDDSNVGIAAFTQDNIVFSKTVNFKDISDIFCNEGENDTCINPWNTGMYWAKKSDKTTDPYATESNHRLVYTGGSILIGTEDMVTVSDINSASDHDGSDDATDDMTGENLLFVADGAVGAKLYCDENGENCADMSEIGAKDLDSVLEIGNESSRTMSIGRVYYDAASVGDIIASETEFNGEPIACEDGQFIQKTVWGWACADGASLWKESWDDDIYYSTSAWTVRIDDATGNILVDAIYVNDTSVDWWDSNQLAHFWYVDSQDLALKSKIDNLENEFNITTGEIWDTSFSELNFDGNVNINKVEGAESVTGRLNVEGVTTFGWNISLTKSNSKIYFWESGGIYLGDGWYISEIDTLNPYENQLYITGATKIISSSEADNVSLIVKKDASQTADLQQWQNETGEVLLKVTNEWWIEFKDAVSKFDASGNLYLWYGKWDDDEPQRSLYATGDVYANDICLENEDEESVCFSEADITGAISSVDTTLTEEEVDAMVANNGYLTSVTNADVEVDAAIDGTKINPDFWDQDIITTGNIDANMITSSEMKVVSDNIDSTTVIVRKTINQNSDLQQWQSDSGINLARIDKNGKLYLGDDAEGVSSYLDVNGNIKASGTVDGNELCINGDCKVSWSDITGDYVKKSGDTMTGDLSFSENRTIDFNNWGTISDINTLTPYENQLYITGATKIISSSEADNVSLIVKKDASQTADLQQWQNETGEVLVRIENDGNTSIGETGEDQADRDLFVSGTVKSDEFCTVNGDGTYDCFTNEDIKAAAETKWIDGTDPLDAVYMDGNVGIGTDAPISNLEVVGSTGISIKNALESNRIMTDIFWNLVFGSNNAATVRMIINDDSGNVGIGTETPLEKLHIENGALQFYNVGASDDVEIIKIAETTESDEFSLQGMFADAGVNNSIKFRSRWTDDILTMKGDGNVGIGTDAPGYKLDIAATGDNEDLLRLSHPDSPEAAGFMIGFNTGTTANEAVTFGVEYSGTDYDVMSMSRSNRNVGIGTTTPTQKLDVVGNIEADGLCINGDCKASWNNIGGINTLQEVTDEGAITTNTITANGGFTFGNGNTSAHINHDGAFYRYGSQAYITVDDNFYIRDSGSATNAFHFNTNSGVATFNGGTVWTSGNDGSGSGLDADLLDGKDGAYYLDDTDTVLTESQVDTYVANNGYFTTSNDGSGSGLDADLLDGQTGSYYLDNTDDQNLSEVLTQGTDAGGNKITNLGAPTSGNDAATKTYVDDLINGLSWQEPVDFEEDLSTCNASNEAEARFVKDVNIIYVCNGSSWVEMSSTAGIPNLAGDVTGSLTSNVIANNKVTSAKILDGTISSADILDGTITATDIANSTITNLDVSSTAAIAGTKISPNFGSQNVVTTGNMGVGTTSPASSPDLSTGISKILQIGDNSGNVELRLAGANGQDVSSRLVFDNSAAGDGMSIFFNSDTDTYGPDGLVFWGDNSWNSVMKLNRDNGNVGIGTTDPDAKFTVKSSGTIGTVTSANLNNAAIQITDGSTIMAFDPNQIINNASQLAIQNTRTTGAIDLYTPGKTDIAFRVNYTGNVGIGTTTPTAKLHVSGGDTLLDTGILVKRGTVAGSGSTGGQVIFGVTDTSADRTVTLSTADMADGRIMIIKDESGGATAHNITLNTQGTETIDGADEVFITVDYGVIRVYSDGTNWYSF